MTETESKWCERVRSWRASGQTAKEFAEGKEYKPSTLTYWASQLRRASGPEADDVVVDRGKPRVRMVRVVSRPARRAPEESVVVAVGTARIVVRAGFDPSLLREVVDALGGVR